MIVFGTNLLSNISPKALNLNAQLALFLVQIRFRSNAHFSWVILKCAKRKAEEEKEQLYSSLRIKLKVKEIRVKCFKLG